MATIKYNGMELQSIDECRVFEAPLEMLVWNTNYDRPIKKLVCAIIPYRHKGSVITSGGAFEHCAEIPKKPAPRRATNRELSRWLAQGNGEAFLEGTNFAVSTEHIYSREIEDELCGEQYVVRKWSDTEWHEPTVDYLNLDDDYYNFNKKYKGE